MQSLESALLNVHEVAVNFLYNSLATPEVFQLNGVKVDGSDSLIDGMPF
jgi:hypothetical protein